MTAPDFDAAREAATGQNPTFTMFGREWQLGTIPGVALTSYLTTTKRADQYDAVLATIAVFVAEDLDLWNEYVTKGSPAVKATRGPKAVKARKAYPPLSIGEMEDLVVWAMEKTTGRPTRRFATS